MESLDQMRDGLWKDLETMPTSDRDDMTPFPRFMTVIKDKVDEFKDNTNF